MIPSVQQCFQLMDDYHMLGNIREHSLLVARVAGLVAHEFCSQGYGISLEKTVAGALLHDIAKTACLGSGDDHAELGREICLRHGYDEIAEIVGEHVVLKNGVGHHGCREKEIVYYADKRVLHDKVVSLEARLAYILERYGRNDPRLHGLIRENFETCRVVEERLFALLPWAPPDIGAQIDGQAIELGALAL